MDFKLIAKFLSILFAGSLAINCVWFMWAVSGAEGLSFWFGLLMFGLLCKLFGVGWSKTDGY